MRNIFFEWNEYVHAIMKKKKIKIKYIEQHIWPEYVEYQIFPALEE